MSRKSYRTARRNRAAALADMLDSPGVQPLAPAAQVQAARPEVPALLRQAVALVEARPALVDWEDGQPVVLEGTGFRLRRLYRPALVGNSLDLIVLYNPGNYVPAFPVATLVGTRYRAMTDLESFRQWAALQPLRGPEGGV